MVWIPLFLDPSDGVFGRFDLAALCGCRTLNFCLFLFCGRDAKGDKETELVSKVGRKLLAMKDERGGPKVCARSSVGCPTLICMC